MSTLISGISPNFYQQQANVFGSAAGGQGANPFANVNRSAGGGTGLQQNTSFISGGGGGGLGGGGNRSSSQSTSAPEMIPGMQGIYNQLLGINEGRYGNVMNAYKGGQQNLQSQLPGIYQQYGKIQGDVMNTLGMGQVLGQNGNWGVAGPAAQAIGQQDAQQEGQITQRMTDAGLGNTSVPGNLQNQRGLFTKQAYGGLGAQLAQTAAGYQSQIGLAGAGAQMQGLGMETGLTQAALGPLGQQASNTAGSLTGQASSSFSQGAAEYPPNYGGGGGSMGGGQQARGYAGGYGGGQAGGSGWTPGFAGGAMAVGSQGHGGGGGGGGMGASSMPNPLRPFDQQQSSHLAGDMGLMGSYGSFNPNTNAPTGSRPFGVQPYDFIDPGYGESFSRQSGLDPSYDPWSLDQSGGQSSYSQPWWGGFDTGLDAGYVPG